MANKGANKLTRVILGAADRQIHRQVFPAVLGTIRSDMSLVLDISPEPIPAGEYLVAELFKLPEKWQTKEQNGHIHEIETPKELLPLKPGNRVICLPVNGGSDYAVIGRIL